jgi:carbonic anhydrase
MDRILSGVGRFQHDVFPERRELFESIAHGQHPRALFITCSDSRIDPNLITQTVPGELFLCRDVGNIVPPYGSAAGGVSATIEYAVGVLKVRHVIICGHTDCGAMRVLLDPSSVADLPMVASWVRHAEAARVTVRAQHPDVHGEDAWMAMIRQNVISQLVNLSTHPSVAAGVATGTLDIHGWWYDIASGAIEVWDDRARSWSPASEQLSRWSH